MFWLGLRDSQSTTHSIKGVHPCNPPFRNIAVAMIHTFLGAGSLLPHDYYLPELGLNPHLIDCE
jgi:hypothetical protein